MKKLLLGVLAIATVFSLAACGNKEEIEEPVTTTPAVETTPVPAEPTPVETKEEQVGVGNTDEGMVALVLEEHLKAAFPDAIEEVVPNNIKVYTPEEIANDEGLKTYTINEGDIVFEANYDLKIKEGVEDLNQFTAATGEIDGQWIRNKFNLGIARTGENGYTIDAFGTGW